MIVLSDLVSGMIIITVGYCAARCKEFQFVSEDTRYVDDSNLS